MNDVTALLHRAVEEEPALGFGPDDLVTRGRLSRRRRRLVSGTASLAVVALVTASFAAFARDDGTGVTVASPPRAESTPGVPAKVTQANLAETVAQQLAITFRDVWVQTRDKMPSGEDALSLYGAVADSGGDSMFSLFSYSIGERGSRKTSELVDCGSDFGNPDGPPEASYTGECTTRTLADGSKLVVRSVRAPGGYARNAAMLVRPDWSGLSVESTNQDSVDPATCVESLEKKECPVAPITRTDPGVTAEALADLLVALEPATR